jgi:hypothetical protein
MARREKRETDGDGGTFVNSSLAIYATRLTAAAPTVQNTDIYLEPILCTNKDLKCSNAPVERMCKRRARYPGSVSRTSLIV